MTEGAAIRWLRDIAESRTEKNLPEDWRDCRACVRARADALSARASQHGTYEIVVHGTSAHLRPIAGTGVLSVSEVCSALEEMHGQALNSA